MKQLAKNGTTVHIVQKVIEFIRLIGEPTVITKDIVHLLLTLWLMGHPNGGIIVTGREHRGMANRRVWVLLTNRGTPEVTRIVRKDELRIKTATTNGHIAYSKIV